MDINTIKRKMLIKYPFFGSIVANVNYKENEDLDIAATDGETVFYNKANLEELPINQQVFVFSHEICHIAFNHILRSEGKNPAMWNVATDAVINQFLKRDGLPMVEGGVDIPEAINYDAEQFYEKLVKEMEQGENQQQSNNSNNNSQEQKKNSSNNNNSQEQKKNNSNNNESQEQKENNSSPESNNEKKKDAGHDTHKMWKEAVKRHKEQQEKENNNNQTKQQEISEKEGFNKNREEKKKKLEELKKDLMKQASIAGTSDKGSNRNIKDIGKAKQLVDWRYVLRETITYKADWSYKNATVEDGIVVPNLEKQPYPETEIVIDTSGSINEKLLKKFLRECKNILQYTKLKVGCFDTRFYGFHEIRTEEDIEKMKFVGGGGTNFDTAVHAFSKRVDNKIIFTDGEAPMPKESLDAIWIVFGGEKINPKGGKVIRIEPYLLNDYYLLRNDKIKQKTR